MKILVTGSSGLLGRYLDRVMDAEHTWYSTIQPWTRHRMDVRDPDGIAHVFAKVRPDVVVHMAATGDVDWCEQNYTAAEQIIVKGTRNVLRQAREYKSKVVYASTNAVFGGGQPPYTPYCKRRPVNRYGAFRKRAENLVSTYGSEWLIIRLFLLYGWQPKGARDNWASRLVAMLGRQETPTLVGDRFWQPTYAGYAAAAIRDLVLAGETGAWHVMGASRVTLHGFGVSVAGAFGYDSEQVKMISSDELPKAIAPRPRDASYDPKAENTIVTPGLGAGLEEMREESCGFLCEVAQPFGWVPEAGCPIHDY